MGVGLLPEATGSGLRGEDRTGGVPGQSGSLSPGWKTRHPRHPQEPSYFRVRLPHVHKYDFNCAKSRGVIPAAGRAGAGGLPSVPEEPGCCTVGLPHGGPRDLMEACAPDAEPGDQPWSKRDSRKDPSRFIPCLSFPFSKASTWGCNSSSGQQGETEPSISLRASSAPGRFGVLLFLVSLSRPG